jgi:heme exporter protein A
MAVDAQEVSRRYGRRWALVGATFSLPQGMVLMVAGPNGSGKSTLLRLCATAIRPNFGQLRVGGFDVVKDRDDVRHLSAFLSHDTYNYDDLTARENLEVSASPIGVKMDRIPLLLDRVGLGNRARDRVSSFSAGMRKRLAIARVMMQQPHVAFLDEPYASLDPEGYALVDLLLEQLRSIRASVVISTHMVDRVRPLSDRVLLLDRGFVKWTGKASEAPL